MHNIPERMYEMATCWEPDDVIAVIDALNEKYGEQALELLDQVLDKTAFQCGQELAERDHNRTSPKAFVGHFTNDPNSHVRIIDEGENYVTIETDKCRLCEIFKELKNEQIGYRFKCRLDYALLNGYDQNINLKNEKNMMLGDKTCIHRYTKAN